LSVPGAYNFTKSGSGDYSIEPSNLFTYVDADGTPKDLYATVEDAIEVKLSGNLAVSRPHDKRASFVSCSATRQSQINAAASSAQGLANNAHSYLQSISSGTRRYTTWFGAYTASRKSTVQSHFRLINSRQFSGFTYDCTCTDSGIYAYVCTYILQSWDCLSVTDRSLDQIPARSEGSTYAVPSGMPPPPVPIPRLERSFTSPPTSPRTVTPMIMPMASLTAEAWPPATLLGPSTTPTVTSTLLRTAPLCKRYLSWALRETVPIRTPKTPELCVERM